MWRQHLQTCTSALIVGMCAFSLLHEALAHLEHATAISLIFLGSGVHTLFHVLPSRCRHRKRVTAFQDLDRCQECQECEPTSTQQASTQQASTQQTSTQQASIQDVACALAPLYVAMGLHVCADGIVVGMAMHTRIAKSMGLVMSVCMVQDSVILLQRTLIRCSGRRRRILVGVLLVACIAVVFFLSIAAGFLHDVPPPIVSGGIAISIGMLLHEAAHGARHSHRCVDAFLSFLALGLSALFFFLGM